MEDKHLVIHGEKMVGPFYEFGKAQGYALSNGLPLQNVRPLVSPDQQTKSHLEIAREIVAKADTWVEAVKNLRSQTSLGLSEAKDIVFDLRPEWRKP